MTHPIDIQVIIWTDRLRLAQRQTDEAVTELVSLGVFPERPPEFGLRSREDGRPMWGYKLRGIPFKSLKFPEDQEANARVAFQKVLDAWLEERGFKRPETETGRRPSVPETLFADAASWIIKNVRSVDGPAKTAKIRHRELVITVRLVELFFPGAKLKELRQADMDRWVAWLSGKQVEEVDKGKLPPIEKARAPDRVVGARHGLEGAKEKALTLRRALITFAKGHESAWTPLFDFSVQRGGRMRPVPVREGVARILQAMNYGCRIVRDTDDWLRRPVFDTKKKKWIQRRVCDEAFAKKARPYLRPVRLMAKAGLRGVDILALRYAPSALGGHLEITDLEGAPVKPDKDTKKIERAAEETIVRLFSKTAGAPGTNKRAAKSRLQHGAGQMLIRWRNADHDLIEAAKAAGAEPPLICRDEKGFPLEEMSDYLWDQIIRRAGLSDQRFTFYRLKAFFVTGLFHRAGYATKEIAGMVQVREEQLFGHYIGDDEQPDYDGPKNLFAARAKPATPYLDDTTGAVRPGAALRRDADGRRIPRKA